MDFSVNVVTVGIHKENCYLIILGSDCWLIDPGNESEKIIFSFDLMNRNLNGIINTHGHFDHIGAVAEIKEKFKVPFLIHSKDERLIFQANLYLKMLGEPSIKNTPVVDKYLDNLGSIFLHNREVHIHHTPGHTNGSVCFESEGNLFTGDLFFEDGIGRTDLPGGNKNLISASIRYVIDNFSGFMIYPGHGKPFILEDRIIQKLKKFIL